jgi:2-polyprenyl-6-methoxyphenol hydroxylase-like FAD-dependent oxidoreductase
MRILVVGAGIAGLTLAALLRRQGHEPVIVERRSEEADLGYGLALWPHGSRVFHGLGVHDAFVAESEPMGRYTARDASGTVLSTSEMPTSISAYGHLGIIPRADLLDILGTALGGVEIRRSMTVDDLDQTEDDVRVRLSDGSEERFDLVVGADGIHSRVRRLLFGDVPDRDTGWGCYVWWARPELTEPGETTERYGAGRFLGTYPCRKQLCVIAGAPVDALAPDRPQGRTDRIASLLRSVGVDAEAYLEDLPADDEDLFLWRMADVRSPRWIQNRVALVGDAAAAFLPTAGIGASMALESAAALADELSRTNATYLPRALELYERRRRDRVEAAQTQSRRLAKLMFIRSEPLAAVRSRAFRFASMEQMVGPLIKELRRPI